MGIYKVMIHSTPHLLFSKRSNASYSTYYEHDELHCEKKNDKVGVQVGGIKHPEILTA